MWSLNSLQQLKTQVLKAKSYKSKPRDAQIYMLAFEKYFNSVKHSANCQKVIEYFVQIFVACLHLNPNQKINQTFKKLIYWLNDLRSCTNCRAAYFLVKFVVEICEHLLSQSRLLEASLQHKKNMEEDKKKDKRRQKDKSQQNSRSMSKQRQKQRQKSASTQRKSPQVNIQNVKNNIKIVLSLVRKSREKNMLSQQIHQIYPTFIQYYLERVSHQVQEKIQAKNSNLIKSSNGNSNTESSSSPDLGSPILSELSTMLSNRNKPQVSTLMRKYIQQSQLMVGNSPSLHIGIYLLLQIKNLPSLLGPVLASLGPIRYHRSIQQVARRYFDSSFSQSSNIWNCHLILRSLLNYMLEAIKYGFKNINKFNIFPYLYKLYPLNNVCYLTNSEQLLDRMYVHLSLSSTVLDLSKQKQDFNLKQGNEPESNWKQLKLQFLNCHSEYIQCTKISSYSLQQTQKSLSSNILSINYVIKLFLLQIFFFNRELVRQQSRQQLQVQVNEILSLLKKQTKRSFRNKMIDQSVEQANFDKLVRIQNNFDKFIKSLCQQLVSVLRDLDFGISRGKFIEKDLFGGVDSFSDISSALKRNKQLQEKVKILISQICYSQQQGRATQQRMKQIRLLFKLNEGNEIFADYWKILLHSMFELTNIKTAEDKQREQQKIGLLYNKQSLSVMSLMSIRPASVVEIKNKLGQNNRQQIFQQNNRMCLACLEVLQNLVSEQDFQIDKQEFVSYIKKCMTEAFDKVDQQVIRDVIITNLFLTKCLLMTGHQAKCKFLMQLVIRNWQMGSAQHRVGIQQNLHKLLPSIPTQITMQFCRYIATKDKLFFRMLLFQKQLTSLDYLVQSNLYDVVTKSNSNPVGSTPSVQLPTHVWKQ